MTTMFQFQLDITPSLLVVISFFGLIIADLSGQDVREDSICYGTRCNTHRLSCSGNNIAVMSAEFAYIENCTCEKSSYRCRTCQGDIKTELNTALSCKIPYRHDDYWGLVKTCSRETNCYIDLPEPIVDTDCNSSERFSHIKYRCVQKKAEIPFCGGEIQSSRRVSLFFSGSTSPNTSQHCICRITSTSVYSITALDVRFGDAANSTTLRMQYSTNNITHIFKERNVKPNTLLLHTTTKTSAAIHLEMHSNYMPERIWLLVEASETANLTIKCESQDVQLPTSHPNNENQNVPLLPSIIGGCAACLIVVLGVIMVGRYKRKRRTDPGQVDDKSIVESKDGNRGNQHLYDIVKEIPENESTQLFTSDHENLEEESYHYIEAQVSTLKTVSSKECISSYSHLNEIANGYDEVTVARSVKDDTGSNYDTMASASHSAEGLIQEDLDSYDHLGQPFTKAPPEGDYDSTC